MINKKIKLIIESKFKQFELNINQINELISNDYRFENLVCDIIESKIYGINIDSFDIKEKITLPVFENEHWLTIEL